MKINRKSKVFFAVFWSVILIPVIIIGILNYNKEQKLNKQIELSKTTRVLSLNNISTSITSEELFEIETSKEYISEKDTSVYNEKILTVTYTNTSFFASDCKKDYVFYDNKLGRCIFTVDTSHWMPKDIYEELVKINGKPDITQKDKFENNSYTWYGKNGSLYYNDDKIARSIEINFDLSTWEES